MKKILLSVLVFSAIVSYGQDNHFSQFNMTPLNMDASNTAKDGDWRVFLNYKDQWRSVTNPFKTFGFSIERSYSKTNKLDHFWGFGLAVFNDKSGDLNVGTLEMDLSAAYHVKVAKDQYLSSGVQVGFGQKSIDMSNAQFDNQYDGTEFNASMVSNENIASESFSYPDISAGVSYSMGMGNRGVKVRSNNGFNNYMVNAGVGLHHIVPVKYSFNGVKTEKLGLRMVYHGWGNIPIISTKLAVQPSGFISIQSKASELTVGAMFRYNLIEQSKYTGWVKGVAFSAGGFYRNKDAFIVSSFLEFGAWGLGVSYDLNTSGVAQGRGGMEIALRFLTPNPFGYRGTGRF